MDRAPWEWMPSPRTPKEVVSELQGLAAYLEDLSRSDPRCCADIAPDLVAVSGRLQKLAA